MVLHGSSSLKWAIIRLFPSNIHGDKLILVPYRWGLGDLSVMLAQVQAGGIFFSQYDSIKSQVLLSCCMRTYPFPLLTAWQILGSNSLNCVLKWKNQYFRRSDHYPTPTPLPRPPPFPSFARLTAHSHYTPNTPSYTWSILTIQLA